MFTTHPKLITQHINGKTASRLTADVKLLMLIKISIRLVSELFFFHGARKVSSIVSRI